MTISQPHAAVVLVAGHPACNRKEAGSTPASGSNNKKVDTMSDELTETEAIPLDEFGRKHGLYTKEWLTFLKQGETMPIMKEILRREDLRDTYYTVLALLMADEEVSLPPLDMMRVALHTMRELKLITYELSHGIQALPESHPKLANAIQRAATQVDQLRRDHRQRRVEGGLFEELQKNISKMKLEVEFKEAAVDEHVDIIEGAFKKIDDEEDDEDDEA